MCTESTRKHKSCFPKGFNTLNCASHFFPEASTDRTVQNPYAPGSKGGLGFYFTEQVKMANPQPHSQLPVTNESLYYCCNLVITYSLNVDPLAFLRPWTFVRKSVWNYTRHPGLPSSFLWLRGANISYPSCPTEKPDEKIVPGYSITPRLCINTEAKAQFTQPTSKILLTSGSSTTVLSGFI